MRAISLEGGGLRAVFVPDVGAKMVSLMDTEHDYEWLVDSGDRPLRPVEYGATFTDQDMSGWDEMFPTITQCRYPGDGRHAGVSLPDHGEVWCLRWTATRTDSGASCAVSDGGDSIVFIVEGRALPYRLTRKVSLSVGATGGVRVIGAARAAGDRGAAGAAGSAGAADWAGTDGAAGAARVACTDGPAAARAAGANRELRLEYEVTNLGQDPLVYLWAAHPQFVAGPDTQILLPDEINEVCNVLPSERWGPVGTRYAWPEAVDRTGKVWRLDRVGPEAARDCRKFYVPPEQRVDHAGLKCHKTGRQLVMSWSAEKTPYLGLWIDEGCYNTVSTVALEPASGYFDSLETAAGLGRTPVLQPGESHEWLLTVRLS